MNKPLTLLLSLPILLLVPLMAQASPSETEIGVAIYADEDISVAPQIIEILPIGHVDDPEAYHVQVKTEPLVIVYLTDSLARTSTAQTKDTGSTWVEMDLLDDEVQDLQVVAVDYWDNSALTEVILTRKAGNKNSFDLDYTSLGRADTQTKAIASELTKKTMEQTGVDMKNIIKDRLIESARQNESFGSSLSGSAEPFSAVALSPYGYYSLLLGFIFLVVGFYIRSTPLPTDPS